VAVDRAQLEGRFTSDRETSFLLEPSGTSRREGPKRTWRRMVEEEIGKVGKKLEPWPKTESAEILPGSPVPLEE
jgi:hypothetical protein